MRVAVLVMLSLPLAGCVQFPQVDDATSHAAQDADYPELIPLDPIADVLRGPDTPPEDTEDALEARISGLNARADRLRGPVLNDADRTRLAETPQ